MRARDVADAAGRCPSVLHCAGLLLALKLALRFYGFGWVIRGIGRRMERIPASTWLEMEKVKSVEQVVATAAALYPGRALCLEQSLLLYYLLRRHGVPVKYCQGVMPHPFQAHAWIEYEGEVVSDVAEHARQFVRLPIHLP